jgi:hypothetical protein
MILYIISDGDELKKKIRIIKKEKKFYWVFDWYYK